MGASAVPIVGLTETRGLLAKFEPDLLKRLDSRLNVVARTLKSGAQANFERTGAGGTAYRIKTRNRASGFSKSVIATSGGVASGEKWSSQPGVLAAIFELAAGVRGAQPQNRERTRSLIDTLNAKYGQPGRFLWAAWDDIKDESMSVVEATIRETEAEYTRRLV